MLRETNKISHFETLFRILGYVIGTSQIDKIDPDDVDTLKTISHKLFSTKEVKILERLKLTKDEAKVLYNYFRTFHEKKFRNKSQY
jgi:predicted NAD/FAD-binding protein